MGQVKYPLSNPDAQNAPLGLADIWPGKHHGPPLPSTDKPQAADSNTPANIALETGSTGFVDCLVRLQAEAAVVCGLRT